jgi:hypothetical protein
LATVVWVDHGLSGPETAVPAPPTASTTASATATAPRSSGACRDDTDCAAALALSAADPACRQAITQLAVYGVRWTAGEPAQRFPRHTRSDAAAGAITFSGQGAEFEDGSGAYRSVRYECDFDPGPRAVLNVQARPGR